ncbi:DUF2786 domain-containing protein [Rhodococcus sp. OK302]|uniref:DUF2786 domain-containing protein n=1 Tax=Rhodococcus sp. OK302 TaxID=1882769 RepID=UPI000B9F7E03|nr:DUF2786 domain-containing protein [Rhodococcus sp. OK302]OYD71726.1 uncharacterized protein DUF2786 [Rhodococcus sp. OK302]
MSSHEVSPQSVAAARALMAELTGSYERGWQPADIIHLARRSKDSSNADLAATAVLLEAAITKAEDRAPLEWVGQLQSIREQYPNSHRIASRIALDDSLFRSLAAGLLFEDPYFLVSQVAEVAMSWTRLAPWNLLLPMPSTWPAQRTESSYSGAATEVDAKVLKRIRGLLAKAEATNFAEEAEIFTEKAQELMTRYAIDSALLHSRTGVTGTTVDGRRIHLDNPYVKEKVHLLTAIGDANRVRAVWFSDICIATVIGTPVDLQQVDMLFTSLLVQATRAMQFADTSNRGGSRTTSFRKGFLTGFANRIGQRLRDAGTKATAEAADAESMDVADLLPILATTSAAVDTEFERMFPRTRKARGRSVDAEGWHAGQAAADDANLRPGAPAVRR